MNIRALCEGIKLDPAARQQVYEFQMKEDEYLVYKQHFYFDRFSFFETVKSLPGYRKLLLYLFVRFAVDAYKEYRIRNIEDKIYYDTFSDIQIWCMQCLRDYGEYGIEEYNWLQEHVQLRLFRLGRMQFQPFAMDRDLVVDGCKVFTNQIVLNVHIPAGEPLCVQGVGESFQFARAFFRGITPVFICHSWLLDPELSEILNPESNIIQFQCQFNIYEVDKSSKEAEERIFNQLSESPHDYEENTRLQRNAKSFLIAGGKLGSGYGIKVLAP